VNTLTDFRWPQLILVNGPSSAGKTTLCRALQDAIPHPYLVTGFDDFVFMVPPRYYRGANTSSQDQRDAFTAQGVEMLSTARPGESPCVVAHFGPVFRRVVDSMAPAVRALVDAGNAVIFDHVLHDAAMFDSYHRATTGLDVFEVGVSCPLATLEARESQRGDRVLGRARGLYEVVHTFVDYDVMVDTGAMPTAECVEVVLKALFRAEAEISGSE